MLNFLTLILYYFLILYSILGYGLLIKKITNTNLDENCFGYLGLFGIIGILIYSYFINYFFGHEKNYNILFLLVGVFIFFYSLIKNLKSYKKEFNFTLILFLIFIVGIFISKTHDDFHYYHFPYTYYLIEQKMVIGTGLFSQGFRTPSSIFYFNSNLYLPLIDYYLFNLFPVYILGFGNLILIKEILKKEINFFNFLSLLSLIFVNIFFYRLAEHGTDRSAMILIFIFVIEILKQLNIRDTNKDRIFKIYILISLIISLKAFYFLYTIFLFPIFFQHVLIYKNIKKFFSNFIFNRSFLISFIITIFVIMSYFFNSSCLIYPVSFTCIENVNWSLTSDDIKSSNEWFELWSKAGATPNYVTNVDERSEYISKFNWVNNWFYQYFFTKVSDFIFGILLLGLIIFFSFYKIRDKNIHKKNQIKFLSILLISLILIFEWFYNHPALRYGGYSIISLSLFLIVSKFLSRFIFEKKNFIKLASFFIILSLIVFVSRNIHRINKEIELYNYKPLTNPFYKIDERHFRLQKHVINLKNNYKACKIADSQCDNKVSPNVKKSFGYYLLYR